MFSLTRRNHERRKASCNASRSYRFANCSTRSLNKTTQEVSRFVCKPHLADATQAKPNRLPKQSDTLRRFKTSQMCGKMVSCLWKNCRKDVALQPGFYTNTQTKVVLSTCGRSCHGVTGHEARSTVCCEGRFVSVVENRNSHLLLRMRVTAATKFLFFWRMYRGQEESCNSNKEGS